MDRPRDQRDDLLGWFPVTYQVDAPERCAKSRDKACPLEDAGESPNQSPGGVMVVVTEEPLILTEMQFVIAVVIEQADVMMQCCGDGRHSFPVGMTSACVSTVVPGP